LAVLERHTENAPGQIDANRFADKARHARTAAGPFCPFASMSDPIRGDRSSSIEAERADSIDRVLTALACGDNDDVDGDDDPARRRCLVKAGSGVNMTINNAAAIRKEVRWRAWTVHDLLESSSTATAASAASDAPPCDDHDDGRQTRRRQSTCLPRRRGQQRRRRRRRRLRPSSR
jgi:hypothetical protein